MIFTFTNFYIHNEWYESRMESISQWLYLNDIEREREMKLDTKVSGIKFIEHFIPIQIQCYILWSIHCATSCQTCVWCLHFNNFDANKNDKSRNVCNVKDLLEEFAESFQNFYIFSSCMWWKYFHIDMLWCEFMHS